MDQSIQTKDWIVVFATLLAPVLAVQVQKYLERLRESRDRKLKVFHTLMATRANRLSHEHVRALNLIDIEFYNKAGVLNNDRKYRSVIDAWKNYQDHLSNAQRDARTWSEKNDELFVELLYEMSIALGYDYDKIVIKRRAYAPQGHEDQENQEQLIRDGMAQIMSGKAALPIYVVNNSMETEGEVAE